MKRHSIALLVASLAFSSLSAVAGCAAPSAAEGDPVEATADRLSSIGESMTGQYTWNYEQSGPFVDIQEIALKSDGTYTASVDASFVSAGTVCIASPCTLPESGKWDATKEGSSTRLHLDPEGGKPRRSYTAVRAGSSLELSRDGKTTTLFAPTSIKKCATMLCGPDTQCVDHPSGGVCERLPSRCATVLCGPGTQCVELENGVACEPMR